MTEVSPGKASLVRLAAECRRLAALNRSEGWTGNECDEAMRALNTCAAILEASAYDSGYAGSRGVSPVLWDLIEAADALAKNRENEQ